MCIEVNVLGEWAGTQGELASALGVRVTDLPLDKQYDEAGRDKCLCLCPIDIVAAVSMVGLVAFRDSVFDWKTTVPGHECG